MDVVNEDREVDNKLLKRLNAMLLFHCLMGGRSEKIKRLAPDNRDEFLFFER